MLAFVAVVAVAGVLVGIAVLLVTLIKELRITRKHAERAHYAVGRVEQTLIDMLTLDTIIGEPEQIVARALRDLREDLEHLRNNNG